MAAPRNTASSRELSVFAQDVDYHLEATGLLRVTKVKKTGDPLCALSIVCVAVGHYTDSTVIAKEIERVWREAPLGFGGADVIKTEVRADFVRAKFAARDESTTVTGTIDVQIPNPEDGRLRAK